MQPIGDHLRAGVQGHLARRLVPGLHHPFGAKDLDALIVAICGAAAVVDLADTTMLDGFSDTQVIGVKMTTEADHGCCTMKT
ncbi:MAG: hypothetical protein AUG82_09110 [Ktedonobacter sp. 13_1_20CM_4_53_11]|nr:MAG: hypothetical protein AUG82_09110 [Ktedonobacter sp. 13_1_20CM_4_53_11]